MGDLHATLTSIRELPSAPTVVLRLHELMERDDFGSHEVARVVETDAALVAKILKLVNSPFYGYSRKVASIDEAIAILGSYSVQQLVLATAVFDTMGGADDRTLDIRAFWWHCVGVGTCAKHLLMKSHRELRNEGVMCGLLHDVGYLVLAKMDPPRFEALFVAQDGAADERQCFGYNHEEVGAKLAEAWNFPLGITSAIAYHHSPDEAPEKFQKLVSAVHVGDILSRTLGIGAAVNRYVSDFWPPAFEVLELGKADLRRVVERVLDEAKGLGEVFGA